jgi:invasion protein IalB
MRRRGTKNARFAGVAIVTAALLAAGAPATGAAAKQSGAGKPKAKTRANAPFCSAPVVNNYWGPVEKLRPIPAVPEGGALRFAPAGTTLAPTGPQGLLLAGSNIGFRLTNGAPATEAASPQLNWIVLERLIRLTDEGRRLHPEGLKRIDLKQLPAGKHRGLTFAIPATPALYSLEVTIQNHRGKLLGRYGQYVRVVNRVVNVGLTLSATDKVAPGTNIESCFENHGSATVTPTGTNLEYLENGSWRPVVVGPQYSPSQSTIQRTLGAGEAEKIATLVPPNAKPGLYKLNAFGTTDLGEPVALSAEFGVL